MKIHKVSYHDEVAGSSAVWCSSAKKAATERARLRREGVQIFGTEVVDVPTDKKGLTRWLNLYARLQ